MSRPDAPFDCHYLESELGEHLGAKCFRVGFSGGADSTALLHALLALRETHQLDVAAIHFNHGLQPEADAWEQHCIEWCESRSVPLHTVQLALGSRAGMGVEAEARRQRYATIESLLEHGEIFLTAHHRDDQAETLLLNLLRASGVDGLAGMPRERPLGKGHLVRPLLETSGANLRAYLRDRGLEWLEDPSNRRLNHDRNYLRHSVMPLLEERWPSAAARLARSARYCGQASSALQQLANARLGTLLRRDRLMALPDKSPPVTLEVSLLVRQWLKLSEIECPPAARLDEFCRQLEDTGADSQVSMVWAGGRIREYDGLLWLDQDTPSPTKAEASNWDGTGPLELGGARGHIAFSTPPRLRDAPLEVRFRRGGERIQLAHGGPHKSVKNLLRALRFPPWFRTEVPLIFEESILVAVADLYLEHGFRQHLERQSVQLQWTPGDDLMAHVHKQGLQQLVDPPQALG